MSQVSSIHCSTSSKRFRSVYSSLLQSAFNMTFLLNHRNSRRSLEACLSKRPSSSSVQCEVRSHSSRGYISFQVLTHSITDSSTLTNLIGIRTSPSNAHLTSVVLGARCCRIPALKLPDVPGKAISRFYGYSCYVSRCVLMYMFCFLLL